MSEQWEIELAEIRKRQDEIYDQIKTLQKESDNLSKQASKYHNLVMQRDYGMSLGDKLLVTDEFRAMLRERDGWSEYSRNSFLNARYLSLGMIGYNQLGNVYVENTRSGTGNVPAAMLKRMRQAWLKEHPTVQNPE